MDDVGDVKVRVCLMTARRSIVQYLGVFDMKNEAKELNSQIVKMMKAPSLQKFRFNLRIFNFFAPSSLGTGLASTWPQLILTR